MIEEKILKVEALQLLENNVDEMSDFVNGNIKKPFGHLSIVVITTKWGDVSVNPGEWVLKFPNQHCVVCGSGAIRDSEVL